MTALHYAAARGSIPIVKVLVKFQAPLDAPDGAGMTALHAAVIHDRHFLLPVLIQRKFFLHTLTCFWVSI